MNIEVPFLRYENIREIAEQFLTVHRPSRTVPIPIEEIIELNLKINIAPLPNLWKDFRIDGYLNSNRTTIYVDQHQYENLNEKYRFTLAHELGHYLLHEEIYKSGEFDSFSQYLDWMESIPDSDLDWVEWQGNNFAGLVLVPGPELIMVSEEVVSNYCYNSKLASLKSNELVWSYLAEKIARVFEVSPTTVQIRIKMDNIPKKVPLPFDND